MNIKYPETLEIEIRIASSEHRNISSTIFDVKKYHELNFNFFWTQKYHFGNIVTQKCQTYLPVCAFSVRPLGLIHREFYLPSGLASRCFQSLLVDFVV